MTPTIWRASAFLTAWAFSFANLASADTEPIRLPNIVLIFADDLGYADVGVFGAKGFSTPNLDRLASQGIRFTDFHVAQPVCSASRTALLTGCYPSRLSIHGALGPRNTHGIHDDETTLAELLKQQGYATGMVGKWHLGHHPQFLPVRHGFDEYFGLPYSNDMWPHHPEAKPGSYPPLPLIENDRVLDPEITPDEQPQLTTWYTERAVRFIDKNADRPFFLYVAHSMPHVPLFVSDKFRGKSEQGLYGDVIMEIDWSVGEILGALSRHNLERDTIVIFTSDNGPWLSYGNHAGSAGPLREGKGTTWEGGTRVPFIARWPGKIPAGKVCDEQAMTIDLFPTFARLTGATLPAKKIDGLDIWPLLAGEEGAKNPHDAYFFYYQQNELQAVRSGPWKLMLPHTYRSLQGRAGGRDGVPARYDAVKITQPELYNLKDDIGEKTDVAEQHPEIVQRLLAFAEQARSELGDSLTNRTGSGVREPGRVPSP
jgi:arylsulfatase A